jgi:membrane protein
MRDRNSGSNRPGDIGRKLAVTDQRANQPAKAVHEMERRPAESTSKPAEGAPKEEPLSPWKLGGLSGMELAKRVWKSVNDDDVLGRSAQLAYYFFLALFPALICVTALIGLVAGSSTKLHDALLTYIGTALPPSAYDLVSKTLEHTAQASGGGKIGFGILASLWSATAGMTALEDTLNAVYNVRESRPLWKVYGVAIAMTIVGSFLVIAALALILFGGNAADFVASRVGLGPLAVWSWKILQWPIAFAFLALVFSLTYYFCPDVDQRHWQWLTPGAVVGMVTWVLASAALRIYLHYYDSYTATYGSLGAVMILLLWFYVTGLMLLLGAEINAEIENAAAKQGFPDAKHKGQKTPQTPAKTA